MSLLTVSDLEVCFHMNNQTYKALHSISFELKAGERLGIVGESGAGKSLLGFAILRLIAKPGFINNGVVRFDQQDLLTIPEKQLHQIRGNHIAMIFQDPMVTLNPVLTIETQMVECLLAHRKISFKKAREIAVKKLHMVQIPSPEQRLKQYPHELSGGMRQRVVIAIALLLDPKLIIADEPTTALDVTIQAEIMQLLKDLCEQHDMALILITHDLGVVAQMTHRTIVMYAGRIVEQAATHEIISQPRHPYTQGLIKALPQANTQTNTETNTQTNSGHGRLYQIPGQMPTIENQISGCPFHPRCTQQATEITKCKQQMPKLTDLPVEVANESSGTEASTTQPTPTTKVACHLYRSN